MKERLTYINGKWVPESSAGMHIFDFGFMFGSSSFDMFRTFNHVDFLFDEHIDRLFMSMKSSYITVDKTRDEIKSICDELKEKNKEFFENDEYRFMINVSHGLLGIYKDVLVADGIEWNKTSWIINAWPLSKTAKTLAHFYDTGSNAIITSQRQIPAQFLDPKIKSRSRLHYHLANVEASSHGPDAQALLLDADGFICEGTGANFLIIKNNTIITPERRNMLRGCSMTYILDVLAPKLGLSVVEKNIEQYDVLEADEAMFTGTFANLLPCNRLNGRFIRGHEHDKSVMGPITKSICDLWSSHVGVDFVQQVKDWKRAE